jgi:hypothetical protein
VLAVQVEISLSDGVRVETTVATAASSFPIPRSITTTTVNRSPEEGIVTCP